MSDFRIQPHYDGYPRLRFENPDRVRTLTFGFVQAMFIHGTLALFTLSEANGMSYFDKPHSLVRLVVLLGGMVGCFAVTFPLVKSLVAIRGWHKAVPWIAGVVMALNAPIWWLSIGGKDNVWIAAPLFVTMGEMLLVMRLFVEGVRRLPTRLAARAQDELPG